MSRASVKRRKKQLQRRAQQNYGGMSFDAAMKTLVAQQASKMMQQNNGVIFSPGIPLDPQPGVTPQHTPRQYSFPLTINTSGVDRTLGKPDIPSFQQLRMLAKMYSGITLPERVWLDLIPGLTLKIGLTAEMKAQGYNDKDFQKDIDVYRKFFEKPDKKLDYHSWLRKGIRSQTQIDDVYAYKRRTRGGALYALEWVDGATVKPLLDDWGRIPEPPEPAFQQYPWGIPGDWFTTDEMIHYQESPQDDSPFGFSRVERFMLEVNQALRKKRRDLALFTEGNVPAGIMEVPEAMNWTADEIDKYEKLWNSLIAGNEQQVVRVKFTMPGMKYTKTDTGEILTDFDYFLYKIAFGIYGVPLTYAGFVEDVHKSSDEGQKNVIYNRTIGPIVKMYAWLFFTNTIHEEFNDPRFEAAFTGYEEEEDAQTKASTFATMAGIGAIAPSDVAHAMGYPDVPKTGPFILTKNGPLFLKDYEEGSDLRNAQKQVQLAVTDPGQQSDQDQENEDEDDDTGSQSQEAGTASAGQKLKAAKSGRRSQAAQSAQSEESKRKTTEEPHLKRSTGVGRPNPGMMLAFMLDPAIAEQLALPDGEDPVDMHVTLAYLGDVHDTPPQGKLHPAETRDALSAVLKAFTQPMKPLQGNVGGLGRFTPSQSSDGLSPVIALVNVPGLQDFRRRLVDAVESAGYAVIKTFDYTPHITLKYIDTDDPMPVDHIENVPLLFDRVCLVIGDDRYWFFLDSEEGANHERTRSAENGLRWSESSEQAVRAELKRWRTCALRDVERGRSPRTFESAILSLGERARIQDALTGATTADQVRAIFRAAQEGKTNFFERAVSADMDDDANADSGQVDPDTYRKKLVEAIIALILATHYSGYRLTEGDKLRLAQDLAAMYVTAHHWAYTQVQQVVGDMLALPGSAVSHDNAMIWAKEQTASIDATMQKQLANFQKKLSLITKTEELPPAAKTQEWLKDYADYKAPQIVNVAWGTGADLGTNAALKDILNTGQDAAPPISADNIRVRVVPDESSSDLCREYAGSDYAIDEYFSLQVRWPMHPNCPHRIEAYLADSGADVSGDITGDEE